MFTVDASVWVNAYSPAEPGQSVSLALLNSLFAQGSTIIVPTLLPVEIAAAISRTRGNSELANDVATALFALPALQWVSLDVSLAKQAWQIAAQYRLRGADAVYAAVARAFNCELISLDQEHLTRLAAVVRTSSPSEAMTRIRNQP